MQKSEFEKQMQQKMDELKIHPSESVWQNIEAGITKNKRRKRGWVFPVLFLIGLLVGGYFLKDSINEKDRYDKKLSKKSIPEENIPGKTKTNESTVKNTARIKEHKKISPQSIIKKDGSKKNILQAHNLKIAVYKSALKSSQKIIPMNSQIGKESLVVDLIENKNPVSKDIQDLKQENKIIPDRLNKNTVNKSDSSLVQGVTDSGKKNEQAKNEIIVSNQTKTTKLPTTKNVWKWGLTFAAGVSGIPTSFLGSLDKSYSAADAMSFAAQGNSLPSQGNPAPLPSQIKSSGALIAGFFTEKNISKKEMITIGLNYKMFSTSNKVGQKNDSAMSYRASNPVDKYHNYYHFVELPVSLKVQISSNKIHLFWDAGVSVSQLIGSNALQFNNVSGVYKKENSLFNKTQIGFNTGLAASLFSRQKISVLIGPSIYYGTTKVATEGLYKNQHFTFIGLRSQLLFKK